MHTPVRGKARLGAAATIVVACGAIAVASAGATSPSAPADSMLPAMSVERPTETSTQSPAPEPAALPWIGRASVNQSFAAPDANQAIAVDADHIYAVNNHSITKLDKRTGEPVLQWYSPDDGPILHLDSGVIVDGTLYAAHSNYPTWPMSSSIETFDAETLEHLESHSFGIDRGSLTWLDRHDGFWWAGFANYDRVHPGASEAYGMTVNTKVVKLDDEFQVVEAFTIPFELLQTFSPMSNSGGSWGPDGRLWLSGHDAGEVYAMELPDAGSELRWMATVEVAEIEGQGIAWDRTADEPTLWGIFRPDSVVVEFSMPLPPFDPAPAAVGTVHPPDSIVVDE